MLWDKKILGLNITECKPDIMWETPKECKIIEISCPNDDNAVIAMNRKIEKYDEQLSHKLQQLKPHKAVLNTPIVIGSTGAITKRAVKHIEELDCDISVSWLQKIVTYRTTRMVAELLRHRR